MVLKHFMMTVALLVLVAGVATAQCPRMSAPAATAAQPAATAGDTGQAMGARMMGKMMQAQVTWQDWTYKLSGHILQKLNAAGEVIKSVKVDFAAACPRMRQGMTHGNQASCGARAGATTAAVPAGCCGGGRAMQSGSDNHGPELTADADGVTLRCCTKLFAWDLDLNPTGTQDLRAENCGGGRCQGAVEERALVAGTVSLKTSRLCPKSGKLPLALVIKDAEGNADNSATVSAFLYPKGQPASGSGVELLGTDTGVFQGLAVLSESGAWELAVRVIRPGVADEVVYYMFDAK